MSAFVALGDRRYRVDRKWYQMQDNQNLQAVSMVAVNSADRVYVFQRGLPSLVVFDPSGAICDEWGTCEVTDAHGIYVSADDTIVLVDRDGHRVLVLREHRIVRVIGDAERPRFGAPFNHPADAAVAGNGDIYVADGYGNACVHRFSEEGEHLQTWGRPGTRPGEFMTPHAVWCMADGRVLVADRENDRVQVFTATGELIDIWTGFYHPMDIYVDRDANVFVTDQVPRLSMLTPDGRLVGRCKPVPVGAHGVWGDSRGSIYLAEVGPIDRVTRLTPLE